MISKNLDFYRHSLVWHNNYAGEVSCFREAKLHHYGFIVISKDQTAKDINQEFRMGLLYVLLLSNNTLRFLVQPGKELGEDKG